MCAYMRSQSIPWSLFWPVLEPQAQESMIIHRSKDDHQQVHGSAVDHGKNSCKLHSRRACSLGGFCLLSRWGLSSRAWNNYSFTVKNVAVIVDDCHFRPEECKGKTRHMLSSLQHHSGAFIPRLWECNLTIHYQSVKAHHQAYPG